MITRSEERVGERDYSILYLRHGIPEAFKVFFIEYYAELFSFAQLMLQDRGEARKTTLEAFFLVWDRRTDFDSAKKIKTFLYLAIRNKCFQWQKAPAPRTTEMHVIDTTPASLPPELLRELFVFSDHVIAR
jgi:DNA-directed RNA polymerase specialized sigma24 family protein